MGVHDSLGPAPFSAETDKNVCFTRLCAERMLVCLRSRVLSGARPHREWLPLFAVG